MSVGRVDTLVSRQATRSLEPVGPADGPRYQFTHEVLLIHAREHRRLRDPEYRGRIQA